MKLVRSFVILSLLTMAAPEAGVALAQDAPLPFLHALQERGYGDVAVQYMKSLEKQRPPELQDVWDLELSKSYRAAAADAFDANDREQLMAESERHLEKFIKEKPDHPEAVAAMAGWASFLTTRALQEIQKAKSVEGTDKQERDSHLADARAILADARSNIETAQKRFKARLAELGPSAKSSGKKGGRGATTADLREQTESNLQEAQYQLALIDYYVAQTYPDPKGADHIAALRKAAKALNDVYQQDRARATGLTVVGLCAHMWEGKACEELGEVETALDIYDEVLVAAPTPGESSQANGLEPLFAQVEYFRILLLAKQGPQKFLSEATQWLKDNARFKQTEGYQGISVEVAKALMAKAARASTTEKTKLSGEAMRILNDVVKIESAYRPEAIRLLHNLRLAANEGKSDQEKIDANTFDEAAGMGDACMAGGQWNKALEWYGLARKLAPKASSKDQARIDAVREAINGAQYEIARDLYDKDKFSECIEAVNKLVRDDDGSVKKTSPAAAKASAMAVAAALNLYRDAAAEDKKAAALDKLMKLAEFTEKNWPDRPEADDARMARGQAKLHAEQLGDAVAIFDHVNPKSERYPMAAYLAGMTYALRYKAEKDKPEDARNNQQMASDLAKAIERVSNGLTVLKSQTESGTPLPKYYLQMQLLLAEIRDEAGQFKEAAALYQPMIDIIEAERPQQFDDTTIRIFLGAVRAYSASGDLEKAGKVSDLLVDIGPDTLEVNGALIKFARLLNEECKKASAIVTKMERTAHDQELNAAKVRLASVQELLGKMLLKLAQRQQFSLSGMMFLGENLNALSMTAEAAGEFQKILDRTATDKDFAKAAEKAMPRIRTELLRSLRERGQFDEALKQVGQLIKEHPNALDPLIERARILEAWAEKDPAKFDEAVAQWSLVRNVPALKKRPEEYYGANYSVAKCLMHEAQQSKEKAVTLDRAKKAEQVLKACLVLNPALSGPDMVAKYKVLLDQAIALQGRPPENKNAKKAEKTS